MPRVLTLSGLRALGDTQPASLLTRSQLVPPFVSPTPCQNPLLPTNKGCGSPIDCALSGLRGLANLASLGRLRLGAGEMDASAGGGDTMSGSALPPSPGGSSSAWYNSPVIYTLGLAATGAAAYHGYKRTRSVGWAIGWGLFGAFLPVIALPVAFAQGFGKRG